MMHLCDRFWWHWFQWFLWLFPSWGVLCRGILKISVKHFHLTIAASCKYKTIKNIITASIKLHSYNFTLFYSLRLHGSRSLIHGSITFTGPKHWFSNRRVSANIAVNTKVKMQLDFSNLNIQVHIHIYILSRITINLARHKDIFSKLSHEYHPCQPSTTSYFPWNRSLRSTPCWVNHYRSEGVGEGRKMGTSVM